MCYDLFNYPQIDSLSCRDLLSREIFDFRYLINNLSMCRYLYRVQDLCHEESLENKEKSVKSRSIRPNCITPLALIDNKLDSNFLIIFIFMT